MGLIGQIKTILTIERAMTNIKGAYTMNTTGVKPGWKTTEFWGKVAIQVFTLFGAAKGFLSPEKAVLISTILEGVYSIARAIVKAKGGELPDVPSIASTNVTLTK